MGLVNSILGSLLFLIYINDMTSDVKHSHLFLFADNAKCFKHVAMYFLNQTTNFYKMTSTFWLIRVTHGY